MKPARFRYHAPDSLEEVLALLAEHGDEARPLAGGQSLMPLLNMRLADVGHLIDLNAIAAAGGAGGAGIGGGTDGGGTAAPDGARGASANGDAAAGSPGLDRISVAGKWVRIGALVRQRTAEYSELLPPLLRVGIAHIAHPVIRNRGTVVGSVAHADPAGELPALLCVLGGRVVLQSRDGERVLDAADFFVGWFQTARRPDELVVAVDVPASGRGGADVAHSTDGAVGGADGADGSDSTDGSESTDSAGRAEGTGSTVSMDSTDAAGDAGGAGAAGYGFEEVARRHGDYAMCGAAAFAGPDGARVSLFGVQATPHTTDVTAEWAAGDLSAATEAATAGLSPVADIHADSSYRLRLARVVTRRALQQAQRRSEEARRHG